MEPNALILSLLFGVLGSAIFIYGKKQSRIPHMVTGVLLCIYPYFFSNLYLLTGVGIFLCLALVGAVKLGL